MKRIFCIVLFLLPLLCGCWDYTELNMQNYVLGMSIDYQDNKYHVCIETVKITGEPESLSASDGVVIETKGLTVFDAVRDAIMSAGKKLYWGHTKLLVLSEDVAKEHLTAVCDVLSRAQDVYSNISLTVANGCTARDILTSDTPRGTLVSEHISRILENEEPSRRFFDTQLWQLQRNFPYTLIPAVRLERYPIVEGSAVIADKQLIGFLSGEQTQIYTMLDAPGSGGYLPLIAVDDVFVTLEVLRFNTVKLRDKTRLDVIVSLSSVSDSCDIADKGFRKRLCEATELYISKQIDEILKKPFGNPLPDVNFEVFAELNSTGLLRYAS